MAPVFPPGPASKVPTNNHFSAAPAHIHTCELSPLPSPFPKPSKEQLRQPGAQTSTTPHPAPHPLHTKWKESPLLGQGQPAAQASTAEPQREAAWAKGRGYQGCSLPLWGRSPSSWPLWLGWPAVSTSFWTARCCWVPKQQKTPTSICA